MLFQFLCYSVILCFQKYVQIFDWRRRWRHVGWKPLLNQSNIKILLKTYLIRGGSRTAATSKMEHFVITVNGWKLLTIITKGSILDDAAVLVPPLTHWSHWVFFQQKYYNYLSHFIYTISNCCIHPVDC